MQTKKLLELKRYETNPIASNGMFADYRFELGKQSSANNFNQILERNNLIKNIQANIFTPKNKNEIQKKAFHSDALNQRTKALQQALKESLPPQIGKNYSAERREIFFSSESKLRNYSLSPKRIFSDKKLQLKNPDIFFLSKEKKKCFKLFNNKLKSHLRNSKGINLDRNASSNISRIHSKKSSTDNYSGLSNCNLENKKKEKASKKNLGIEANNLLSNSRSNSSINTNLLAYEGKKSTKPLFFETSQKSILEKSGSPVDQSAILEEIENYTFLKNGKQIIKTGNNFKFPGNIVFKNNFTSFYETPTKIRFSKSASLIVNNLACESHSRNRNSNNKSDITNENSIAHQNNSLRKIMNLFNFNKITFKINNPKQNCEDVRYVDQDDLTVKKNHKIQNKRKLVNFLDDSSIDFLPLPRKLTLDDSQIFYNKTNTADIRNNINNNNNFDSNNSNNWHNASLKANIINKSLLLQSYQDCTSIAFNLRNSENAYNNKLLIMNNNHSNINNYMNNNNKNLNFLKGKNLLQVNEKVDYSPAIVQKSSENPFQITKSKKNKQSYYFMKDTNEMNSPDCAEGTVTNNDQELFMKNEGDFQCQEDLINKSLLLQNNSSLKLTKSDINTSNKMNQQENTDLKTNFKSYISNNKSVMTQLNTEKRFLREAITFDKPEVQKNLNFEALEKSYSNINSLNSSKSKNSDSQADRNNIERSILYDLILDNEYNEANETSQINNANVGKNNFQTNKSLELFSDNSKDDILCDIDSDQNSNSKIKIKLRNNLDEFQFDFKNYFSPTLNNQKKDDFNEIIMGDINNIFEYVNKNKHESNFYETDEPDNQARFSARELQKANAHSLFFPCVINRSLKSQSNNTSFNNLSNNYLLPNLSLEKINEDFNEDFNNQEKLDRFSALDNCISNKSQVSYQSNNPNSSSSIILTQQENFGISNNNNNSNINTNINVNVNNISQGQIQNYNIIKNKILNFNNCSNTSSKKSLLSIASNTSENKMFLNTNKINKVKLIINQEDNDKADKIILDSINNNNNNSNDFNNINSKNSSNNMNNFCVNNLESSENSQNVNINNLKLFNNYLNNETTRYNNVLKSLNSSAMLESLTHPAGVNQSTFTNFNLAALNEPILRSLGGYGGASHFNDANATENIISNNNCNNILSRLNNSNAYNFNCNNSAFSLTNCTQNVSNNNLQELLRRNINLSKALVENLSQAHSDQVNAKYDYCNTSNNSFAFNSQISNIMSTNNNVNVNNNIINNINKNPNAKIINNANNLSITNNNDTILLSSCPNLFYPSQNPSQISALQNLNLIANNNLSSNLNISGALCAFSQQSSTSDINNNINNNHYNISHQNRRNLLFSFPSSSANSLSQFSEVNLNLPNSIYTNSQISNLTSSRDNNNLFSQAFANINFSSQSVSSGSTKVDSTASSTITIENELLPYFFNHNLLPPGKENDDAYKLLLINKIKDVKLPRYRSDFFKKRTNSDMFYLNSLLRNNQTSLFSDQTNLGFLNQNNDQNYIIPNPELFGNNSSTTINNNPNNFNTTTNRNPNANINNNNNLFTNYNLLQSNDFLPYKELLISKNSYGRKLFQLCEEDEFDYKGGLPQTKFIKYRQINSCMSSYNSYISFDEKKTGKFFFKIYRDEDLGFEEKYQKLSKIHVNRLFYRIFEILSFFINFF